MPFSPYNQNESSLNQVVRYSVPVHFESAESGIKITGIAIEDTTSRNGITYQAKELDKAAKTLENKPIGLNHNSKVEDIVGKVISTESINGGQKIKYEGIIKDTEKNKGIVSMVKEGLIQSVSIEAIFKKLERLTDKSGKTIKYIARGIEFTCLDLVKTPGVANASVSFAESFESAIQNNLYTNNNQMELFKKVLESLTARDYVSKDDKNLLNSLYESLSDDEKSEVKADVDVVQDKPEQQEPSDDGGQVSESMKKQISESYKKLSEQYEKEKAERIKLSEQFKKKQVQEEANNFLLSENNKIGFKESDKLVEFMLGLSDDQMESFKSLFEDIKALDLKEHGSDINEESLSENKEDLEAKKLAEEIKKTNPTLEDWQAMDKAYEKLGLK